MVSGISDGPEGSTSQWAGFRKAPLWVMMLLNTAVMIQHSRGASRSSSSSSDALVSKHRGKTVKMSPPSLWLDGRQRGHPWSISRGCKPRRTASIRDSCSRCLTRRGGCGTYGTGWGWRWSRTAARWFCTASHTWTRTCRCWRWGRGEVAGPGLEEGGWEGGWGPLDDAVCCVVIRRMIRRMIRRVQQPLCCWECRVGILCCSLIRNHW